MNDEPERISFHLTLLQRLRAYLFAGTLITAPVVITLYVAWLAVSFVDERVARLFPPAYNPNTYLPFTVPGLGMLLVAVVLVLIGSLTAGFIGRLWVRVTEAVVARLPIIRSVYGAVKQIFETVLATRQNSFRQVVMLEFPRRGLWRMAFVTGTTPGKTQTINRGGLISVFVPNSPNVTAGFLVMVPPEDLIELDITAEEALKLMVSGGIAIPERLQPERSSLTAASRSNK